MTHLNPALDSLLIAEALKAASLEDICAELERKAKLCNDMADDCIRFADHEDDPIRAQTMRSQSVGFRLKGDTMARMAETGRGK